MRPILRLKAKLDGKRAGDSRLLRRVAWIYNNEVENYKELRDQHAMVVDVKNAEGKEFGVALFNPRAPLRKPVMAKMIADNVHVEFTAGFFRERILRAQQLRGVFDVPFYRLINAEGDDLPGVTVDQFDDVLVVHFTMPAWEEIFRDAFLEALSDVLHPKGILLRRDGKERQSAFLPDLPPEIVKGDCTLDAPIVVQESGRTYAATLGWDYSLRTLRSTWETHAHYSRVVGSENTWWPNTEGAEAVLVDMPRLSVTAQTPNKIAELFEHKVKDAVEEQTNLLGVVCRDYSIPDIVFRKICVSALPHSSLIFEAEPGLDFPTPLTLPRLRAWRALGFARR